MQGIEPTSLLGYAVATLMLAAGIAVLSGWHTSHLPSQVRVTFGFVLLLFGIYRMATTMMNQRSRRRDEDE